MNNEELENVDISEKGRAADGQVISSERRLYMQLLAYGECPDAAALIPAIEETGITGALYVDLNDPQGVALVVASESPDFFVTDLRHFLNYPPFAGLLPKPEYTMFGRTYAIGYEPDLEQTLITRPRQRLLDPKLPWVIWYPLAYWLLNVATNVIALPRVLMQGRSVRARWVSPDRGVQPADGVHAR